MREPIEIAMFACDQFNSGQFTSIYSVNSSAARNSMHFFHFSLINRIQGDIHNNSRQQTLNKCGTKNVDNNVVRRPIVPVTLPVPIFIKISIDKWHDNVYQNRIEMIPSIELETN